MFLSGNCWNFTTATQPSKCHVLTVAYQLIAVQHSSFGDRPITTLDTEVASWLVS